MEFQDIIAGLESTTRLPRAELAAAGPHAEALAARVIPLLRRAAAGSVLLPREENLVFHGLYVLAAARHAPAFAPLVALLRAPSHVLEEILGDALTEDGPSLLVSLFDGDAGLLLAALEDPDIDDFARWPLFQALAYLAWQGRVPMAAAVDFLIRFHERDMLPPDSDGWGGWEAAMVLLGQAGHEEAIIARAKGYEPRLRPDDIADIRARLAAAAAHPADGRRFAEARIAPIDDAAAALSWVQASPPAIKGRLDPGAMAWLAYYLDSDEAPSFAMSAPELDGFITGLAALAEPVPPARYLPLIWREPGGGPPPIEGEEKRAYIEDILARAPADRAAELAGHGFQVAPWALGYGLEGEPPLGADWAAGFRTAMALDPQGWARIAAHAVHGIAADAIERAAEGAGRAEDRMKPHVALPRIGRTLGEAARTVYRALHGLPAALPASSALRPGKVGRNDPCPCGSGRKYKKCCGAAA